MECRIAFAFGSGVTTMNAGNAGGCMPPRGTGCVAGWIRGPSFLKAAVHGLMSRNWELQFANGARLGMPVGASGPLKTNFWLGWAREGARPRVPAGRAALGS
jgi:hypothetical protein